MPEGEGIQATSMTAASVDRSASEVSNRRISCGHDGDPDTPCDILDVRHGGHDRATPVINNGGGNARQQELTLPRLVSLECGNDRRWPPSATPGYASGRRK